jgi:hypothetical protein
MIKSFLAFATTVMPPATGKGSKAATHHVAMQCKTVVES